ncbi:outer membrane protein assembly factor BamD [Succinimonas amylolytica]|uniref:outer membrane protein assembly factor BamD n=1 Tax=Succinimonas amylolytica TaxID=83769 RepID=UPI0003696A45|nr:outer membrane protein assembly factor BamD [Succinimonas amylolytica]
MIGNLIKYGMLSLTVLWLSACSSVNKDVIPDKEPEELYMKAYESLAEENYGKAKEYLEAIDSRYPFGPYAHQVQMDLIYTYYKDREDDLAIAEIDKFLRLNPQDSNIDYVLYMRGLTNMQKATNRMLNLLFIDTYDRDVSNLEQAFSDFRLLIAKYPKSMYAADSYARMVYIRNTLARHEYDVADFYYRKGAYLSSARRCQNILKSFRDTDTLEDALTLLEKDYLALKLPDLADRTKQFKKMNLR